MTQVGSVGTTDPSFIPAGVFPLGGNILCWYDGATGTNNPWSLRLIAYKTGAALNALTQIGYHEIPQSDLVPAGYHGFTVGQPRRPIPLGGGRWLYVVIVVGPPASPDHPGTRCLAAVMTWDGAAFSLGDWTELYSLVGQPGGLPVAADAFLVSGGEVTFLNSADGESGVEAQYKIVTVTVAGNDVLLDSVTTVTRTGSGGSGNSGINSGVYSGGRFYYCTGYADSYIIIDPAGVTEVNTPVPSPWIPGATSTSGVGGTVGLISGQIRFVTLQVDYGPAGAMGIVCVIYDSGGREIATYSLPVNPSLAIFFNSPKVQKRSGLAIELVIANIGTPVFDTSPPDNSKVYLATVTITDVGIRGADIKRGTDYLVVDRRGITQGFYFPQFYAAAETTNAIVIDEQIFVLSAGIDNSSTVRLSQRTDGLGATRAPRLVSSPGNPPMSVQRSSAPRLGTRNRPR